MFFGQLSLAIIFILKGKMEGFVAWYGIKCSSWTQVNVGTSSRSACASLGDCSKMSVLEANKMLERTGVISRGMRVSLQKFVPPKVL